MIYTALACSIIASAAANSAEFSTSNLRSGASFENFKANWGRKFSVGGVDSQVDCSYDYNENREGLKEVKLSGNLVDGSGDDLSVGYEVTKSFSGDKGTDVTLTASTGGTNFGVDLSADDQLKEVRASRSVSVGDQTLDVEPSFLVKAQKARVKLASAFGKDRVNAQVDYDTNDSSAAFEVGYSRDLEDGRQLSATLTPADKNLEVELVDSKFEDGATWTATANVPLEDAKDGAKLSLKRAWTW
jgi:hypothetical protein